MAREGVSFEEVEQAAARIKGRGDRISLRSVRAELGTGSMSTIQRHLNDLVGGENRKTSNKVDAAELELPEKIIQAIKDELEAGKAGVREELLAELQEARADRDSLATQVDLTTEERDKAFSLNAALQGEMMQLDKQVNSLSKQLEAQRAELHQAKEALAMEKAYAKAMASWKEKAEALEATLNQERELRHGAELEASKQAGLAQRMQDLAVEARTALADTKPPRAKQPTKKTT